MSSSPAGDIGKAAPATAAEAGENEKASPAPAAEEEYPDPDEDDLDDLDDFLPTFSTGKAETKKADVQSSAAAVVVEPPPLEGIGGSAPAPGISAGVRPRIHPPGRLDPGDPGTMIQDPFTKELEKGMESLMAELETQPEMMGQFDEMFRKIALAAAEAARDADLGDDEDWEPEDGLPGPSGKPGAGDAAGTAGAAGAAGNDFQDTIRKTMERMKTSGDRTTEEINSKQAGKGVFEDLLGLLGKVNLDGEGGGAGGDDDVNQMLMGMMEQLTSKDILYEPMKELHDQFPVWLENNKDTVSKEDLARYDTQRAVVAEIVTRFEASSYKDSNAEDRQYIVDRMQKMQEAGAPPPDLLEKLPSAQEVQDGLPDTDALNEEACNPQ